MAGAAKSKLRPFAAASSLALLILGGLVFLGHAARKPVPSKAIIDSEISYTDIACNAPPGRTRGEFLDELRYLGLPAKLDTRSPQAEATIRVAFEKHPRVDGIVSVEIAPARIAVEVRFKSSLQSLPADSKASKPADR